MMITNTYPKFVHNLIMNYDDEELHRWLIVRHSTFELSADDANKFLQIRSHCTGFNSVDEIAEKSGIDRQNVVEILDALESANIIQSQQLDSSIPSLLCSAASLWRDQLSETYLPNDLLRENLCKNVFHGWILESYHLVKAFPNTLAIAAGSAQGDLGGILLNYAEEEWGHEMFYLNCLIKLGYKCDEVESSTPLVSTQAIIQQMEQLVVHKPEAGLLAATLIEGTDYLSLESFLARMASRYHLPIDSLQPLIEHARIVQELGHHLLADIHRTYFEGIDESNASTILNRLHDIKHAYDVQSMEIKDYYGKLGNYIPRQAITCFSI